MPLTPSHLRTLFAALGGALLLTLSAAPAGAAAPSKCVTDQWTHDGRLIFPELRSLGVRVWSWGLPWAEVAATRPLNPTDPTDPAYRWASSLDEAVASAVANGIEPVLDVQQFPAWSNGGRAWQWAPNDPQDFADFIVAAMRHYPDVRRWQIIGEPTRDGNFLPQGGHGKNAPRRYALLLDAAYAAIHAENPDALVIGGNMHPIGLDNARTTDPGTFLANMRLPNGRRARLDLLGINPYGERAPDMSQPRRRFHIDYNDLDWLIQRLDAYYPGRRVKLFVSEFGWLTQANRFWQFRVSRVKQADWLAKGYRMIARLRGRVDTLCWFQVYDSPPKLEGGQPVNWASGLRTWVGTKKPAYDVFRRLPSGPSNPDYPGIYQPARVFGVAAVGTTVDRPAP